MTKDLTLTDLSNFSNDLKEVPASNVIARAVQENGVDAASKNFAAKKELNRVFSIEVETGEVTHQKQSGRCWLFATLNTLRHDFAKKYQLKDFQFSQNYLSFYDRLEKANKMLEWAIRLIDRAEDDREYLAMLEWGDEDGGQWANGPALINKYGLVPQSAMPETYNSDKTAEISRVINLKLRKAIAHMKKMVITPSHEADLRTYKLECLNEIYRMLVYAFGQPPASFDFEYRDKDNNYHNVRNLTPRTFFTDYVAVDFDQYTDLIDAPDHEYGKNYGLPNQDYIFDGKKIELANVGLTAMKKAAIASLKDGQTVWFGCDVIRDMDRKEGILDPNYFKKGELFAADLQLGKAERLATRDAEVSHAMTLTGVDIVDDQPTKWKVENSWGDETGDKGYFIMSDAWFDEYVYEVVVQTQYLQEEDKHVASKKKEDLTPWDSLN
ncbi:C1 family peptidase [Tetragenococcus halophilus]|uniref:Aminopeptidase n=2 Tax=Tetragenococcus halophilus TaxID=51669 RepID=A0A2H6CRI7_TETHA|nr:C1 family peptidase [Tetragenococcus halophilus]AYW49288.1 aminopeptidase [Tetragenococcus halophilus]MCO7026600.1 C1 family peptidase [Tetragenococcus halophilus]MCO8287625.1 C1 family peptidase [Tetragenococcus halophilus]MCO8294462.1 C1 family peptidase [Tetragenococcus halophilus]MCO8298208.1 C1 family peptidase [Tetragenococcus halophilus]